MTEIIKCEKCSKALEVSEVAAIYDRFNWCENCFEEIMEELLYDQKIPNKK